MQASDDKPSDYSDSEGWRKTNAVTEEEWARIGEMLCDAEPRDLALRLIRGSVKKRLDAPTADFGSPTLDAWAAFSEGNLVVQWRSQSGPGILLQIQPDGQCWVSVQRSPSDFYSNNLKPFRLSGEWPEEFSAVMNDNE